MKFRMLMGAAAAALWLGSLPATAQTSWNVSETVTATNNTVYTLGSTVIGRTMNVPNNTTVTIRNATAGATLVNDTYLILFNLQGTNAKVNWEANVSGSNANSTVANRGVVRVEGTGEFIVKSGSIINTANSSYARAISTASSAPTITVQGGTVSATGASYSAQAINAYGTVNVSGGTVSVVSTAGESYAIYGDIDVNISGTAEVSANNGAAIYQSVANSTTTVTGGTVLATGNGYGIYSSATNGSITVSGGTVEATSTNINSRGITVTGSGATVSITGGTVKARNGIAVRTYAANTKITVSGGTVEATGDADSTRAILSINASGSISITGGTVAMTHESPKGFAVQSLSTTKGNINLGGSPTIIGTIRASNNVLAARTEAPVFAPAAARIYTLHPPTYGLGQIAVADGANFINNFRLYNTNYALIKEESNLLIADNINSAAITVTAPVERGTPSTVAAIATGDPNFTVSAVTWSPMPGSGGFQPNTVYTAQVTLTATAGTFQGLTTATINDLPATVTNNIGSAVTLSRQFVLVPAGQEAETPVINVQPVGGTVEIGSTNPLTVQASVSDSGTLSYQWYSWDPSGTATAIAGATSASYVPPTSAAGTFYYYVEVTNTSFRNSSNKATKNSDIATLIVSASISVLSRDRIAPAVIFEDALVVAPTNAPASEFTAGPNPAAKSIGAVGFFRQGKFVSGGTLTIYDISGNIVRKIQITDKSLGNTSRRQVGSWDLRDAKGRPVPEGTYLVRGTVKTADGKSEKVSLVLGVR